MTVTAPSGQRRSGTLGPTWTGIETYAVPKSFWSTASWSVTSSMTAAGPTYPPGEVRVSVRLSSRATARFSAGDALTVFSVVTETTRARGERTWSLSSTVLVESLPSSMSVPATTKGWPLAPVGTWTTAIARAPSSSSMT